MDVYQQILSIIIVLSALGAGVWVLRRRGFANFSFGRHASPGKRLEVVERMPLTASHSVFLIRVGDKLMAVGLSPSGYQILSTEPGSSARSL